MPQLIFLALLAVGGYYVVKAIRREMARVDQQVKEVRKQAENRQAETKPPAMLEKDPETGRYRPKQD